ncbi:MAG: sigma 54-interacting transcriptional regulator [Treponema sp.]|nr:sigma 54-interacting transcriptional regulator [Treponema sp.]MCL2251516.1 sigma 54-interacting transcriptional regulator [Treponema sp.]
MLSKIDAKKFHTLIEINSLINSDYKDVHNLLSQIMESATQLCDAQASSLLLMDKEKNELYFEVALGEKGGEVKKFTVKSGEGIAGWVSHNNKSLIVNDAANDKRHLRNIGEEINYTCKTIIAVPMRIKDECIGVLELINKNDEQGFIQEDMEWLEIFANQAALAVVNAQSMEKSLREIKQLQDRITHDQYHTIITKSPAILEKLDIIDKVAKTDSSVLLLGESGVGKELFAEQIHLRSERCSSPFVRVNCAAIPEGLLESELFGHVKGAFTNAIANRHGRFEMADGGTIFLDEIGDLPLSLQVKLLRVIQEKRFEKVGSDTTVTVNVRIVAATNKNLEEQVEKGAFRQDLYYRLNVFPIYIPALRQRPEDIIALAHFFLDNFMRDSKKQKETRFEGFSQDAIEALLSYSWPGNVRELQNCIERACVIGRNKLINTEDLFLKAYDDKVSMHHHGEKHIQEARDLKAALNNFKVNFIRKVLEENNWNQTETARALAIQRTYLSRLIKELQIEA